MSLGATYVLMALGLGTLIASSTLAALPRAAGPSAEIVIVLAPPWAGGAEAVVARAGGAVIGPEQAVFSVLAYGAESADLRKAGAWAVWPADEAAFYCGTGGNS